ncbi:MULTISPECIES: 50S ribosomal protein L25/general stress protein Ctc [Paenibacillus]|uniref:50S ribosomal protein L25/general stress protein Ctc n=1 Tax=Paenibacillus TaxID=44249 RepID=UPI00020D7D0B|nr:MULTISPECIES: 50S ribosomal protein L25/general stress protein Ctc [Paenibacillus]EGL19680.1 ribosomal protein L25, Ctc-form [Paenibacillus sp. HGF7]EPD80428.1 ribosomal protein L25, Ctc-form [Paenibacillus sp. HGH0039]MBV6717458.1 50S ribosomal protein L25/general stress protein Ctc [Paenibacillus chitinolyticus]
MGVALKGNTRTNATKSEAKQLRRQGKVPGVVYGKTTDSLTVVLERKELVPLLRSHPNAVIDLNIEGVGKRPVLISGVQRDSLSQDVIHIDFHQINMNEPVKATVAVEIVGEAAGVKEGGILQVETAQLDVRCLPDDLPDSVQVDISNLGIGENILVSDLKLPENVEVKTEAEDVVVTVLQPQKEVEETTADEPAAEAEAEETAESKE